MDKYIQKEISFQAMMGPLDNHPFDIHISPFMTSEKPDSNSRRIIMDLTFPNGLSVNDGVIRDMCFGITFQMQYTSADSIIHT